MLENPCFERACDLLLSQVSAVGMEQVPLSECGGRVLAQDLIAQLVRGSAPARVLRNIEAA